MKICVIGLGYIGLPTSLLLANAGYTVVGYDINNKIIEKLMKKQFPFKEPGMDELLIKAKDRFSVRNIVSSSDIYIIAVPTPLDKEMKMADLGAVKNAAQQISKVLKQEQLVILESTVPPGTSEKFVIPILRNKQKSFYYAHCPERAIPGKTLFEMIHNDRIIGGINKESSEKATQLYYSFVKGRLFITDDKTAEFVKLMENTYRDINIALANEFALMSEEIGINGWEAIQLANKHPRVSILNPGPGVGGHCIAIDPYFLAEKSSRSRIVTLAREINGFMPIHVIELVKKMLDGIQNPTITLLGLAYKGNVDDARESPAFKVKMIAESEGMHVKIYDPVIKNYPDICQSLEDAVKNADCIVLITDHEIFKEINPLSLITRRKNLVDTRNILNHLKWKEAGFNVTILGVGNNG